MPTLNFSVGDIVKTKLPKDLEQHFLYISEINEKFASLEEISDRYCTVVEIDDETRLVSVMLDDGAEVQLPQGAFIATENENSCEVHDDFDSGEEDDRSSTEIVRSFAAQSIQFAYRLYEFDHTEKAIIDYLLDF
jgi:hypothetical protein